MRNILATREGLIGRQTAFHGWLISPLVPFVALPCVHALGRAIIVRNELNGRTVEALVLDVGPHYTDDDAYILRGERPRVESEIHPSNRAGIDLGEYVWHALGMQDNGLVSWEFATYPGLILATLRP